MDPSRVFDFDPPHLLSINDYQPDSPRVLALRQRRRSMCTVNQNLIFAGTAPPEP
jgi:hypothetical protein